MTKIKLEKISVSDKYIFIEKGMRGGISYTNKRFSKANNEYCWDYDNEKTKTYITYLDMNNLYGYTASHYLPHANFKWVNNKNEIEEKLVKIKNNSSTRSSVRSRFKVPKRITFRT